MYVVTPKQMKTLESTADQNGTTYEQLMMYAGRELARFIVKRSKNKSKVLFLCGNGNNAGDCFVASNFLGGREVCIAMLCGEPKTELSAKMFATHKSTSKVLYDMESIKQAYQRCDIICDGVFGTGFHGELPKDISDLTKLHTKAIKIAVDIPSGVNCLTGEVSEGTLKADYTLTFGYPKLGATLLPAKSYCGETSVAKIGITHEHVLKGIENPIQILDSKRITLPKRLETGHKGTFGRLLHVTGSKNMLGACIMASKSALRSGVGLLTICTEDHSTLPLAMPEPIYINRDFESISNSLKRSNAVLIGCGLGTDENAVELFKYVVNSAECPLIIDADGINILANCIDIIGNKNVTLTPHLLEFSRLSGLSMEDIQKDRIALAIDFAKTHNCTLVLKGSDYTTITDGKTTYLLICPNSGMGKGGSGDVLSGMVSSFIAQGIEPLEACKLAVYVHSQAGLQCAEKLGEYSMLPTDVISEIPQVLKGLTQV